MWTARSLTAALLLAPAAAAADDSELKASISMAQVYDSNPTFAAETLDSAWFARLETQVGARYGNGSLEASARGLLAAELYDPSHGDLTSPLARQAFEVGLTERASSTLILSLDGAYHEAAVARDLPVVTGADLGRRRARSVTARAALDARVSRRLELGLEYDFMRVAQADVTGDVHSEDLAIAWRASRRATLRGDLMARQVRLESGVVASFTPMAGWSYRLGPGQRLGLRAGPRLTSAGVEDVEGDAELLLVGRRSRVELAYLRARTAAPGYAGALSTDSLRALGSATMGTLTVALSPELIHARDGSTRSWAARGDLELRLPVARWLNVFGAYRVGWQAVTSPAMVETVAHQALVGVIAGDSFAPGALRRGNAPDPFDGAEDAGAPRRLP